MIDGNENEFLWVQKYRPQTIDSCILPQHLKDTFNEFIKSGQLPNFLFSGTAGVGKTTIAKALCAEIGAEYLMINGSDEGRSIDVLRGAIRNFASTISLTDSKKVVIIDEADYTNAQTVQPALRSFMEEFSSNCRFILTCNFKNRIIEPLHSRCTCIEFVVENKDVQKLSASFFKRATRILKTENIEFEPKIVAELITKHFPDYRRILNELQRYSVSGKIDSGILIVSSDELFEPLFELLKVKDFTNVRKWVAINNDIDPTELFRKIYDKSVQFIDTNSLPNLILLLAEYGYKNAFVTDREINTMACLTEIMSSCKFN